MPQFIIRVATRESTIKNFQSSQITFSCPANWHDYAIKHNNNTIGDQLECVYAHIFINDPRLNEKDPIGNPMGNNLTILFNAQKNSLYLRHEPVLLTPAFCFFQRYIDADEDIKHNGLSFDLSAYCTDMGYTLENSLFLVIHDAREFEEDLKHNVPLAVLKNQSILISNGTGGYVQAFDENKPINYSPVDYDKHNYSDFFYEKNSLKKEMWWKSQKYRTQAEGRIVILGVHFRQRYSDVAQYDYSQNHLSVFLPNLKKYASVIDGAKCNYLYFYLENNEIKLKGDYLKI